MSRFHLSVEHERKKHFANQSRQILQRLAISFVYTDALAASITLDNVALEVQEVGTPSDNLYIEIQTDSAGSPSGTVVTNGTSNNLAVSAIGLDRVTRQISWPTPPTLVSGATYWAVIRRSGANDASNYVRTYRLTGTGDIPGYVTKTYTASTTTWSAALATELNISFTFSLDYDGKIVKASNTDLKRANVVGVTKDNVAGGANISYFGQGATISGFTGLSENSDYYASASGAYTVNPTITIPGTTGSPTLLLKAFKAVSPTVAVVDVDDKLAFVSVGNDNTIANSAVSTAGLDVDFAVSCGFAPERTTIYRFASSSTIAQTIKLIRTTPYFDVTTWSTTPSTFFV